MITAQYSNGQFRVIDNIVLATFPNAMVSIRWATRFSRSPWIPVRPKLVQPGQGGRRKHPVRGVGTLHGRLGAGVCFSHHLATKFPDEFAGHHRGGRNVHCSGGSQEVERFNLRRIHMALTSALFTGSQRSQLKRQCHERYRRQYRQRQYGGL